MVIADFSAFFFALIIAIISADLFWPFLCYCFFSKFIVDESVPPFAIIISKIVEDE